MLLCVVLLALSKLPAAALPEHATSRRIMSPVHTASVQRSEVALCRSLSPRTYVPSLASGLCRELARHSARHTGRALLPPRLQLWTSVEASNRGRPIRVHALLVDSRSSPCNDGLHCGAGMRPWNCRASFMSSRAQAIRAYEGIPYRRN